MSQGMPNWLCFVIKRSEISKKNKRKKTMEDTRNNDLYQIHCEQAKRLH